jgi:hypothetical protein
MAIVTSDFSGAPELTPAQVQASLQAREADAAWLAAAQTPGTPQHEEHAALRAALDGQTGPLRAADPTSYYVPRPEGASDEDAASFDAQARGWLAAAGLDSRQGTDVAKAVAEAARTPFDRDGAEAALRAAWRDDYQPRVDAARRLVQHIEQQRPGLVDFLNRTGLGDHPHVISQLSNIAARMFGA